MSSIKYGGDCCGDRYEVNAYEKCKCGCELYYCDSCYRIHMVTIATKLLNTLSADERRKILAIEIKKQRRWCDPKAKFKHKV